MHSSYVGNKKGFISWHRNDWCPRNNLLLARGGNVNCSIAKRKGNWGARYIQISAHGRGNFLPKLFSDQNCNALITTDFILYLKRSFSLQSLIKNRNKFKNNSQPWHWFMDEHCRFLLAEFKLCYLGRWRTITFAYFFDLLRWGTKHKVGFKLVN